MTLNGHVRDGVSNCSRCGMSYFIPWTCEEILRLQANTASHDLEIIIIEEVMTVDMEVTQHYINAKCKRCKLDVYMSVDEWNIKPHRFPTTWSCDEQIVLRLMES